VICDSVDIRANDSNVMELTATTVLLFLGSMIFLTVNFVAGNGLSLLVKGASGFPNLRAPKSYSKLHLSGAQLSASRPSSSMSTLELRVHRPKVFASSGPLDRDRPSFDRIGLVSGWLS
jgi:hypothetical protein